MQELAVFSFSLEDSKRFAMLSGDYNPLHVDPVAARRSPFQQTVAHGVHGLLAALDAWSARQGTLRRLSRVKANFRAPIVEGRCIVVAQTFDDGTDVGLVIQADGEVVQDIVVGTTDGTECVPSFHIPRSCPPRGAPRDRDFASASSAAGEVPLYLETDALAELFPALAARNEGVAIARPSRGHTPGRHGMSGAPLGVHGAGNGVASDARIGSRAALPREQCG